MNKTSKHRGNGKFNGKYMILLSKQSTDPHGNSTISTTLNTPMSNFSQFLDTWSRRGSCVSFLTVGGQNLTIQEKQI